LKLRKCTYVFAITNGLNVVLHNSEGEKKKTGPRKKATKNKMSRSDFMSHQSLLESKSSIVVGSASMNPAISANATMGTSTGMKPSQSVPVLDSQAAAQLIEDSAELARAEQKLRMEKLAKRNRVLGSHQPREGDRNLLLTKSADWGANVRKNPEEFNPAPIAGKQNPKQKELQTKLMGGERVKNPRDRPFMTSSPTARRKKLPPPPLGITTGHGVGVSGHDGLLPSIQSNGDISIMSLSSSSKKKGFTSIKDMTRGGKVERKMADDLDPMR